MTQVHTACDNYTLRCRMFQNVFEKSPVKSNKNVYREENDEEKERKIFSTKGTQPSMKSRVN